MNGPAPHDHARQDYAPLDYTVVVPTVGRCSLDHLLESLDAASGPRPGEVILVDDRSHRDGPLRPGDYSLPITVLQTSGGTGPAAARNVGWRAASSEWVAFLDDDVVVTPSWPERLADDLSGLPLDVAASQGRIVVPLPEGRPPTDWERNIAGLEHACWATADMAYRRRVLDEVGGFCELFPRAFREDADLGLRVTSAGYLIVRGDRTVRHPVRAADRWVSVRLQAGNADDMLMRARHGPDWRQRSHAEPGRNSRHALITASLVVAVTAFAAGRRKTAAAGLLAWAAGTTEFAAARFRPGPRTGEEALTVVSTSCAIPPAAVYHTVRGWATSLKVGHGREPLRFPYPTVRDRYRFGPVPRPVRSDTAWRPRAILFDRDGTLIVDGHYLADPEGVTPMPGARMALARARRAGLSAAVVTNQSGVARGLMTVQEMEAVNRRADDLIGPFDFWAVCCHGPDDGCDCRKPQPGLILKVAAQLGVDASECAVVGDIGCDVEAASAAGARSVLVPTRATLPREIRRAPQVAPDLLTAVDLILAGRC